MKEIFQQNPVYFVMATVGTGLFVIKMVLLLFAGDDVTGVDSADTEDLLDAADHTDGGEALYIDIDSVHISFFYGSGMDWFGCSSRVDVG